MASSRLNIACLAISDLELVFEYNVVPSDFRTRVIDMAIDKNGVNLLAAANLRSIGVAKVRDPLVIIDQLRKVLY